MIKKRIVCTINNKLCDSLNLKKKETTYNLSITHRPKRQDLSLKNGNLHKNSLLANQLTMAKTT